MRLRLVACGLWLVGWHAVRLAHGFEFALLHRFAQHFIQAGLPALAAVLDGVQHVGINAGGDGGLGLLHRWAAPAAQGLQLGSQFCSYFHSVWVSGNATVDGRILCICGEDEPRLSPIGLRGPSP